MRQSAKPVDGAMNKRGIELQFHWIFILIAGAVILAFFFSVVQKQRALSEQKLSITLASQMDAIYAGAIESKGTIQPLATPGPGIAFACSEVCECNYYIGTKPTEFRDKLLFAPDLIKDQDTLAWAIEWKLPFRIANFLMLTSPNIKYNIIYEAGNQQSEQTHRRFLKSLPKEVNQEAFSSVGAIGQFTPQGDLHTRFVFLGVQPQSTSTLGLSQDFADEDVSGVYIDPDFKTVVFYEKVPDELSFNSFPTILAGDATAYAALTAADHQLYDCVMKRAFSRLNVIAQVQSQRAKALQAEMDARGRVECTYVQQDFDKVAQAAGGLATGVSFKDQVSAQSALGIILGTQPELERQNNNLFRQSCPELY